MKKKLSVLILFVFLSSIFISAYGATDNVIIRVGYPRLGENQNVGTVRIYESDATIDSIQEGDIFTIFVENAEFMTPATLVTRGRFDLKIVSGGKDGDSYVTYEFISADPVDTGRVIIDFVLDDMRVTGGDVTARIDSVQSGVTSGYFSLGGSEGKEKEKDEKAIEEEIILKNEQLKEAVEKNVNILIQHDDYQILFKNSILGEKKIQEVMEKKQNLKINIKREKSSDIKYLTETYTILFTVTDKDGKDIENIKEFENDFYLKIKDSEIKDKINVKGVSIKDTQNEFFSTHYDAENDYILIKVNDFKEKISLVRGSNNQELLFNEGEYADHNGQKYIPIRKSAVYYGWDVTWNPYTRVVNLQKDEEIIEVKDYIIIKERSFVSADFLGENIHAPIFILENQVVLKIR